ncbi:MAG: DUF1549 domain-containing protein [Polyangiaceae bacterium]
MTIRQMMVATSVATLLCTAPALAQVDCGEDGEPVATDPPPVGQLLSYTRLLRRVKLTLLGEPPTYEQYQQILGASDDTAREALIEKAIDDALASPRFYHQMVDYGHDYLRVSAYNFGGSNETNWVGGQAVEIKACPMGSTHAGAWGLFHSNWGEDPNVVCNDASANTASVVPWFAPTSSLNVVGRAVPGPDPSGVDCGVTRPMLRENQPAHPGCSCGSNLRFCYRGFYKHNDNFDVEAQRRQAWEEPARLFAHVIWHDRPFSDLVVGDYSVAPLNLKAMYVRMGRQSGVFKNTDTLDWWKPSTWSTSVDPDHEGTNTAAEALLAWREFAVEQLNPHLLSQRDYAFDPRVDTAEPAGIPSAGVMTTMGALSAFPRERVRAARWLEVFACRHFVPPPPEASFKPFERDPATEGVCQHCHVTIDPAAIHFKRWGFAHLSRVPVIGGLGPWTWAAGKFSEEPFARWGKHYLPDTVMTPVSEQVLSSNTEAHFIDFLPDDQTLFGEVSDGTIGPLGFGKLLLQSGEFDRCVVQQLYRRFVGRDLDTGSESTFITELAEKFVDGNRQVRPFLRELLLSDEQLRRGF